GVRGHRCRQGCPQALESANRSPNTGYRRYRDQHQRTLIARWSVMMAQPYVPLERIGTPRTANEAQDFLVDLERYRFAARYVAGKRVLDIASGDGYGASFLATQGGAHSVVGV